MASHVRVITGDATIAAGRDATHGAAQRVAQLMDDQELRRARQHIARLEDALRVHGATTAELEALRYGTTPPIGGAL